LAGAFIEPVFAGDFKIAAHPSGEKKSEEHGFSDESEKCDWVDDLRYGDLQEFRTVDGHGDEIKVLITDADFGLDYRIHYDIVLLNDNDVCGEKFHMSLGSYHRSASPVSDELAIRIQDEDGTLIGGLYAKKGELPTIRDANFQPLPYGPLGPLVITDDWTNPVYTLLDARVLTRLGEVESYHGTPITSSARQDYVDAFHSRYVGSRYQMFTVMAFRADLASLPSWQRREISSEIYHQIREPAIYHFGGVLWEDHHHINHTFARIQQNTSLYGAFWDGHRRFLAVVSRGMYSAPFRRIPAWDTEDNVPREFNISINRRTAPQMPGVLEADTNFCAEFDPANEWPGELHEQIDASEKRLSRSTAGWHNNVHLQIGGSMAPITTSASVRLFYPWHTTVDTIWRNWQLCWPGWQSNYSWPAWSTFPWANELYY